VIEIEDIRPGWMKQGTTRPLFCRASDGRSYVVKNKRTGTRGLIAEYVAARLARLLNIPVPDFAILGVKADLAKQGVHEDSKGLALLPSFGSLFIEDAGELTENHLRTVPDIMRARILLFDWWIANGDRRGWGKPPQWNPNLLWVSTKNKLVAMDHNMAFERWNVDEPEIFWKSHVFANSLKYWDAAFQSSATSELTLAANQLDLIWSEMPAQWTSTEEMVTQKVVYDLLWRFSTDGDKFWRRT